MLSILHEIRAQNSLIKINLIFQQWMLLWPLHFKEVTALSLHTRTILVCTKSYSSKLYRLNKPTHKHCMYLYSILRSFSLCCCSGCNSDTLRYVKSLVVNYECILCSYCNFWCIFYSCANSLYQCVYYCNCVHLLWVFFKLWSIIVRMCIYCNYVSSIVL